MARLIALCAAAALASCGGPYDDEDEAPATAQQALRENTVTPVLEPVLAQAPGQALNAVHQNPAPPREERWYAPVFPLPPAP